MVPDIQLLSSPGWKDYELLDSGDGLKLERFGPYTFVRPEVQALWTRSLPAAAWDSAHAVFQPTGEESGGHWNFKKRVAERWEMSYDLTPAPLGPSISEPGNGGRQGGLKFWVMTTPGRHLGVFPECAAHWDWMTEKIKNEKQKAKNEIQVLNLFGYTGLATLACAAAGARVTHVDASKKSVAWARENASLSGLAERPIRWIVDDALKFVQREARRGIEYDGIYLDPPKFGRGPKGEVWEVYKSLPELLRACREVLSEHPFFVVLTVYAVKLPAVHVYETLGEVMKGLGGQMECGELVTVEKSARRVLSQAVYSRWENL
ncbi:MAG: class I SAM-dependent methyltransferase [Chloroflexota bacterium]